MMRGIYASTSSMLALLRRQESLSNNLANVSTPGFKQEIGVTQVTDGLPAAIDTGGSSPAIGSLGYGETQDVLTVDFNQGPLENTGQPLDLAITGAGFFRVQTPDGVQLTRDGTFLRDGGGFLVTPAGHYLLGDNGPLQIPEGSPYVANDGSIYVNNQAAPAGHIALGQVADQAALQPMPDNLLAPGNQAVTVLPAGQAGIKQGFLEQANVDVSRTVVSMMAALRSYEATMHTLRAQDDAVQKAMQIGQVS